MAEYLQGSITFKDTDGNVVQVNSLTTEDIAKLKEYISKVDTLENYVANDNLGQKTLAYKDYRQDDNKGEMKTGIYYMVPVNASDEFIEFDKATGKPKNPQTVPEVVDLTVVKYYVVYKTQEDTVANLGEIKQQPNFDLFAALADNNTFTGNNTFNNDITLANGASQDVQSIADTTAVAGKIVKGLDTRLKTVEAELPKKITISISEAKPEPGNITANVLYGFKATNLIV